MKLSKNFHSGEFLVSKQYPEIIQKHIFTRSQLDNMEFLCQLILQPIRDKWGPLNIVSGYRTAELNKKIGGANDSDHQLCIAGDFVPLNFNIIPVLKRIVNESNLPYRQVICYPEKGFIHVSINIPGREIKKESFLAHIDGFKTYERGDDLEVIIK